MGLNYCGRLPEIVRGRLPEIVRVKEIRGCEETRDFGIYKDDKMFSSFITLFVFMLWCFPNISVKSRSKNLFPILLVGRLA